MSTTTPARQRRLVTLALLTTLAVPLLAQSAPSALDAYAREEAMVAMRDGTRLHTVIWRPRAPRGPLPVLLERTPYDAERGCRRAIERGEALAREQYVFVCQDLRGKYQSEGQFVMIRPPADAGGVDETTDAWDTIDWITRELRGTTGRVGMRGISYSGWTTMMALRDPHPALKATSPQASPDDMFQGDDFFHNGAFRLSYGFEYVASIDGRTSTPFAFDAVDTYDWFLRLGGLANVDARHFRGQKPMWADFTRHHTFDAFWQQRKVVNQLAALTRLTVPTLTVAGWWDQEDFYGPLTLYEKLESIDRDNLNFLVVGPWNHGGWASGPGNRLGPIEFGRETGAYFRDSIEAPWFAHWLKDTGVLTLPEALTFRVGSNTWERHDHWPPRRAVSTRSLHFSADASLSWAAPTDTAGRDRWVSDPARPVPYRARPVFPLYGGTPPSTWPLWQVDDQRHTHLRPDVLHYATPPLDEDVTISGRVFATLFAETTGSDADWVVKLIDVYPDQMPDAPTMGGFQLMVLGDVVRARFRESLERPVAVTPNEVVRYRVPLNAIDYTFRKGHRIMVHVQSTWFPLIDRNPQTFVPNIFAATDRDYRSATHTVHRSTRHASHLELPVIAP